MTNQWWGLSRRQTIAALVVALVVGVAGAVLIERGDGGPTTPAALDTPTVEPGTPASPHALWVFGLTTLRFDRQLSRARHLAETGFGAVVGRDGRVDLYDVGTGRIGVLRTGRNQLELLGTVHGGSNPASAFTAPITAGAGELWLAPHPGTATPFDPATGHTGPSLDVGDATRPAIATALASSPGTVVAATADDRGVTLARIDPSSATVTARGRIDLATPFTLDGLATDGRRVWVVAADRVHELDADTLTVSTVVDVGRSGQHVKGAVLARGDLWMLARNGASLARLSPGASHSTLPLRILRTVPKTFHLPASLSAQDGIVYALAATGSTSKGHRTRVVEYDIAAHRSARGVELPAALDAGAIAAT